MQSDCQAVLRKRIVVCVKKRGINLATTHGTGHDARSRRSVVGREGGAISPTGLPSLPTSRFCVSGRERFCANTRWPVGRWTLERMRLHKPAASALEWFRYCDVALARGMVVIVICWDDDSRGRILLCDGSTWVWEFAWLLLIVALLLACLCILVCILVLHVLSYCSVLWFCNCGVECI